MLSSISVNSSNLSSTFVRLHVQSCEAVVELLEEHVQIKVFHIAFEIRFSRWVFEIGNHRIGWWVVSHVTSQYSAKSNIFLDHVHSMAY